MAGIESITPSKDGRGIIVGQSGSGKSVLARSLIYHIDKLIIIDPKRMFKPLPGMKVFNCPKKLKRSRSTFAMYRPSPALLDDMDSYNEVYKYAYELGNITVYTDEIVGVITETKYPKYLKICYQMGREKSVRMLTSTQRPAWIPLFIVSECTSFYTFRLVMARDIKRMQECQPLYNPKNLPSRYIFWYTDLNSGEDFASKVDY